jgi:hypothetical protein
MKRPMVPFFEVDVLDPATGLWRTTTKTYDADKAERAKIALETFGDPVRILTTMVYDTRKKGRAA